MIRSFALALALGACLTRTSLAGEQPLRVGDPAPSLEGVRWVKGGPVTSFERGRVYVVEFWATWCDTCKGSLAGVNELARRWRDEGVTVVGVAIWPVADMVPVRRFVEEQGDAMDYAVAEDVGGATAAAWMDAAGRKRIPCAMVVDGEGRISWIGNPVFAADVHGAVRTAMTPPEPRPEPTDIVVLPEGTTLVEIAKIGEHLALVAQEAEETLTRGAELDVGRSLAQLNLLHMSRNWQSIVDFVDGLQASDPLTYVSVTKHKYEALLELGRAEEAAAYARAQLEGPLGTPAPRAQEGGQAQALNELAWFIVSPDTKVSLEERDLVLAYDAAVRANDVTRGEDSLILDTLARVHFWRSQRELQTALLLQLKAVNLPVKKGYERFDQELADVLDMYTSAAEAVDEAVED